MRVNIHYSPKNLSDNIGTILPFPPIFLLG